MERDPHLPHPEVCDWLLRQEWSAPATVHVRSDGHPGFTVDCCEASAAIGRDEMIDLLLPSFGLQVLREDQAARAAALESEATDPRTFDGLKTRIVTTSSQAVNVNGALSLGLLDELMDAVDSGSGEKKCAAPEDPVQETDAARDYYVASGGALCPSSSGKDRRKTASGLGRMWIAGVGRGTGLPVDFLGVDDLIKGREEAEAAPEDPVQETDAAPVPPDELVWEWYVGGGLELRPISLRTVNQYVAARSAEWTWQQARLACAATDAAPVPPENPVDDDAEPGLDALNELIGRLLNAIRDADPPIPVSIAALEAAKTLFLSQVYDLRPRPEE
jgi:hypothetical protein